jgi:hypothetical protein
MTLIENAHFNLLNRQRSVVFAKNHSRYKIGECFVWNREIVCLMNPISYFKSFYGWLRNVSRPKYWVSKGLGMQRHVIIGTHKQHDRQLPSTRDQLAMTLSDVHWSPTTVDVVIRLADPSSQFAIVTNVCRRLYNVKTEVISCRGISSPQIKVYMVFATQLAELWSGKAWWKHHRKRLMGRVVWGVIFQNIGRYIDWVLTPCLAILCTSLELHFQDDNACAHSARAIIIGFGKTT